MRVYVEQDYARDVARIFVYRRAQGDSYERLSLGDGTYQIDEWVNDPVEGRVSERTPTLVLRTDVLEAVVAAASGFLPPSEAVSRHLDDATKTRDRLLSLVEVLATGGAA